MSAEIVWLCDRIQPACEPEIDLRTAVDVAIRDLREIQAHWGTERARERLLECQETLRTAFNAAC